MKKTNASDELKEYCFYLEWEQDKWRNGRSATLWAKSAQDAEIRMQSWRAIGYVPKYLGYTMDEFLTRSNQSEVKSEQDTTNTIEVENV